MICCRAGFRGARPERNPHRLPRWDRKAEREEPRAVPHGRGGRSDRRDLARGARLTVACARCHDHKFDPIPTKDYYALLIFRSTSTHFERRRSGGQNNKNLRRSCRWLSRAAATAEEPRENVSEGRDRLAAFLAGNPDKAKKFASLPPARRAKLVERFSESRDKMGTKQRRNGPPPAITSGNAQAMGVKDARPGDARVLVRGEIDHPGEAVPRGVVTVLTPGVPPVMPLAPAAGWNWRGGSPRRKIRSRRASWSIGCGCIYSARDWSPRRTISVRRARRRAIPSCSITSRSRSCATAGR